jgi:hypothetical protein
MKILSTPVNNMNCSAVKTCTGHTLGNGRYRTCLATIPQMLLRRNDICRRFSPAQITHCERDSLVVHTEQYSNQVNRIQLPHYVGVGRQSTHQRTRCISWFAVHFYRQSTRTFQRGTKLWLTFKVTIELCSSRSEFVESPGSKIHPHTRVHFHVCVFTQSTTQLTLGLTSRTFLSIFLLYLCRKDNRLVTCIGICFHFFRLASLICVLNRTYEILSSLPLWKQPLKV